jgi:hypothetical protein
MHDHRRRAEKTQQEWRSMSRNKRRIFVGIIVITLAGVFLLPGAHPIFAAHPGKIRHARGTTAFSHPSGIPTGQKTFAGALEQQAEVLAGLQVSQSALEKQTADSDSVVHREISQLTADVANSRRESQQDLKQAIEQTSQRIDSLRRWLRSFALLFFVSLGGLLYVISRGSKVREQHYRTWKSEVPEMTYGEIAGWQNGEAAQRGRAGARP